MNLEGFTLSEIGQREKEILHSITCMESKIKQLYSQKPRVKNVFARGQGMMKIGTDW